MSFFANQQVTEGPLNNDDMSKFKERLQVWKRYVTVWETFAEEERESVLKELRAAMQFATRVRAMTEANKERMGEYERQMTSEECEMADDFRKIHFLYQIELQKQMFDEAEALLKELDPHWAKSVNADNVNKKKCCHIQ